jgi:aminoglycoside phosphotransferase
VEVWRRGRGLVPLLHQPGQRVQEGHPVVQKYVWWDEIEQRELVRREIRVPKALDDFCREVAKVHGVSVSGFMVGLLVYAADARSNRRLLVERIPGVRVTEPATASGTVEIPAPVPTPGTIKRWKIPRVL